MYYLVRERGLGMRICREKRMSKEIENEEEKQRKN